MFQVLEFRPTDPQGSSRTKVPLLKVGSTLEFSRPIQSDMDFPEINE